MPLLQLSTSDYAALAQAAGLDVPASEVARVHRLLAVDGYKAEQLLPNEQAIAVLMANWKHAVIREQKNGQETGVEHAAVEVGEIPGRPWRNSPRAVCARRVREQMSYVGPIDAYFYQQIEESFPEVWHKARVLLVCERPDSENVAVETAAAQKYAAWQGEELTRHDRLTNEHLLALLANKPIIETLDDDPNDSPDAVAERAARFQEERAAKRSQIARTWEQLTNDERQKYRDQAEDEWFVTER